MATKKPIHPSQKPESKMQERSRAVVKSMAEMSRLMQAKAMPPGKNNSQGR